MEIFLLLLPLIQECIENNGKDETFRNMRDPGLITQWRIYRAYKRSGKSRREAEELTSDALTALRNASDEDIKELING